MHERERLWMSDSISDKNIANVSEDSDSKPDSFYPPPNFAQVDTGIYRSAFPSVTNFPFLERLNIRTVVYLCLEDYPQTHVDFWAKTGAILYQCGLPSNKDPLDEMPVERVSEALKLLLDETCHPVLVHCNKGKHRTGCLVGIYRRCQSWSLVSAFEEYRRFSFPKDRITDQQFIELFDTSSAIQYVKEHKKTHKIEPHFTTVDHSNCSCCQRPRFLENRTECNLQN